MTRDELWKWAIDHYVLPATDHYRTEMVERLLRLANGDVKEALRLSTKTHWHPDWKGTWYDDDSIAVRLGGHGMCGPGSPSIFVHGSASRYPIEVYFPESSFVGRKPDLIIKWEEVFEYIKAGRKRAVQLELF